MQKVVNVFYHRGAYGNDPLKEINKYLNEGWIVVLMQSFSQSVSVATQHMTTEKIGGDYGMTFVLQKTEDNRKH